MHCGDNIILEVQKDDAHVVYTRSNYHPHIRVISINGQKVANTEYTCTGATDAEVQTNFERFLAPAPIAAIPVSSCHHPKQNSRGIFVTRMKPVRFEVVCSILA